MTEAELRAAARAIWDAGLAAALPEPLMPSAVAALPPFVLAAIEAAPRLVAVGAGKAAAGMAAGLETALAPHLHKLTGRVNVPAGCGRTLQRITLAEVRPHGVNEATPAAAESTRLILAQLAACGPNGVAFVLLSGGASALLPLPVAGVSLADKQAACSALFAAGATIGEVNAVRKHLSQVKGGQLVGAFRGRFAVTLAISDVVGDPPDVIGSGPTVPDPTTFADAVFAFATHKVRPAEGVLQHLTRGALGGLPETPKEADPRGVYGLLATNRNALEAAEQRAAELGFRVDIWPDVEGDTAESARRAVRHLRAVQSEGRTPFCLLIGGETTVDLGTSTGRGGRNQEFALAALAELGAADLAGVAVLSAGTDGEDGPTDAAGAVVSASSWRGADAVASHLVDHDSYRYFDSTGDLLRTGPTGTNVMDLRVLLVV